jgi:hypothetical protein
MRRLQKASVRGFESISRAIRQQPNYDTEISDEYFEALEAQLERKKSADFSLTPVSESGW